AGQFGGQRRLVAGEPLTVAWGQEHPVLVGGVRARDRKRLVLLHLAGQPPRDLDRPDLGPKGTAERPFDEAGDLVFQVLQHAHGWAATSSSRRVSCYASGARSLPDLALARLALDRLMTSATRAPTNAPSSTDAVCTAPAACSAASVATARPVAHRTRRRHSSAGHRRLRVQGRVSAARAQIPAVIGVP